MAWCDSSTHASDERFEERPFCVAHQKSRQDYLPKRNSESDFALFGNQGFQSLKSLIAAQDKGSINRLAFYLGSDRFKDHRLVAIRLDPEFTSGETAVPRLLERVIFFGTENYDRQTRRRLRLLNSLVLITIVLSLGMFLVSFVYLLFSGKSPFSIGNQAVLVGCVLLGVAPFLHRLSDIAAPLYLVATTASLNTVHSFNQGSSQGSHVIFLLALACVPFLFGPQQRVLSFMSMLLLASAYFYVDYYAPAIGVNIKERSDSAIQVIRYLQMLMVILGIYFIVRHSVVVAEDALKALHHERERSERLLRNILPDSIALRLKLNPDTVIADRHHDVTVIFVDLVDFTPTASRLSAEDLVQFLNQIFSEIDTLVEQYGLEKIKTIGDAYMVVAGIPDTMVDNSGFAAEFALAVIAKTHALSKFFDQKVQVRVGMQIGDVVAGVIGKKKFAYDVWGDTVNIAARMEASGVSNRIQVTDTVRAALENRYTFTERGVVDIKGKGPMTLHFLTGRI